MTHATGLAAKRETMANSGSNKRVKTCTQCVPTKQFPYTSYRRHRATHHGYYATTASAVSMEGYADDSDNELATDETLAEHAAYMSRPFPVARAHGMPAASTGRDATVAVAAVPALVMEALALPNTDSHGSDLASADVVDAGVRALAAHAGHHSNSEREREVASPTESAMHFDARDEDFDSGSPDLPPSIAGQAPAIAAASPWQESPHREASAADHMHMDAATDAGWAGDADDVEWQGNSEAEDDELASDSDARDFVFIDPASALEDIAEHQAALAPVPILASAHASGDNGPQPPPLPAPLLAGPTAAAMPAPPPAAASATTATTAAVTAVVTAAVHAQGVGMDYHFHPPQDPGLLAATGANTARAPRLNFVGLITDLPGHEELLQGLDEVSVLVLLVW